jgi:predicted kinase
MINEDGTVYEPKHVARNTTNTSNKLSVVYDYIILYHIYWSSFKTLLFENKPKQGKFYLNCAYSD